MNKEFEDICMKKRIKEIEPSAVFITSPVRISNLAISCSQLSTYFLYGAEDMLTGRSPLLAILLGYFAMEHKAYEILVLNGVKITSHVCAIKGLSRIIMRKDLAAILSKAYENRLEVNYLGNMKTAELDRARAKEFMEKTAVPFISAIDKIIGRLKDK
ncbi:MAG TPA: hypothetical protein VJH97_02485 [Candidatus Nanoarchaeia archaeon]|nr:hypothetical protein [Candidatus Nanoarchaeia archaeon]